MVHTFKYNIKFLVLSNTFFIFTNICLASESGYVKAECAKLSGQVEAVMPDGTRCDCITETHAIEFDYAPKWAEAIGQSLHYARLTGKEPVIALIVGPGDWRFVNRACGVIHEYDLPIRLITIRK